MGLLDFLKTKSTSSEPPPVQTAGRQECDLSKTQLLIDLFNIPQDKRNEAWQKSFCDTVQTASFAGDTPEIFTGPDGFPYFILRTPDVNKQFESFCILNMKDDFLLEKGWGVVINPGDNGADWVFSYGDILNLHLNNEFFSAANNPQLPNAETIKKDQEILIAQPSESYFPRQSRAILKKFLQCIGVKRPMMMMLSRRKEGIMIQELAFNVFVEDFAGRDQLNYCLQRISWFLPRHYIILSVPKKSDLTKQFQDL